MPRQRWKSPRQSGVMNGRGTATSFKISLFQKYSLQLNTNPQIVFVGKGEALARMRVHTRAGGGVKSMRLAVLRMGFVGSTGLSGGQPHNESLYHINHGRG